MNLVIDIGNTLVKAALLKDTKVVEQLKTVYSDKLFKQTEHLLFKCDSCIISSVTKNSKPFEKKVSSFLKHCIVLNSKTKLPFKNLYKTPLTLGHDRIANAAAAVKLLSNKNVLVIDAGTCLKFDFVDSKGNYHGGSISPGLSMRFLSLQVMTGQLPHVTALPQKQFIGNSTVTAIRAGVQHGMISEIDGIISRYKSEFNDVEVILTGGDYRFFANQLKTHIFARPDFTLQGLNEILKFNL